MYCFSSGPCAKRKGWSLSGYQLAGRSHRSSEGLYLIQEVLRLQRKVLQIPDDFLVAIVPGSATGAMELLLWNFVGSRPVDVLDQCVFSHHWAHDVVNELKIPNVNVIKAAFPEVSDTSKVNFGHDLVFCLSSTTSGTSFNDLNWIPADHKGLVICDATSGAFTMNCDWSKLDAVAFSWQKGLGAEAGLGTIVLSPKAVQHLQNFPPDRAMPRMFRIVENGKINSLLFQGYVINTVSLLCVQEFLENLQWADEQGGLPFLLQKVEENYSVVTDWLSKQDMFKFLVNDEEHRAHHIICLGITDENYQRLSVDEKWNFLREIRDRAAEKKYGYDFVGHAATQPHIRIWNGPTIESYELKDFLPNLLKDTRELCCSLIQKQK